MQLSKLAIDTGYEAPAVYAWSRAAGYAQVTPIKGVESFNRSTPVSGPTFVDATIGGKRLRRGARLAYQPRQMRCATIPALGMMPKPAKSRGNCRLVRPRGGYTLVAMYRPTTVNCSQCWR